MPQPSSAKSTKPLTRLRMNYVDVFHFHAVNPNAYADTKNILAPALQRAKDTGKVRHIGITETGPNDPHQEMLQQAVTEPPWEVVMLAYSLINQGARRTIFPKTMERGTGTLLMFVVRNIFSRPDNRRKVIAQLVEKGDLPPSFDREGDPLAFLVSQGGARSITDAAYRFARHETGADVILFGSGNKDHIRQNVESILNPPLAPEFVAHLYDTFGHLVGVGLDLPDHMQ